MLNSETNTVYFMIHNITMFAAILQIKLNQNIFTLF
jgi:hypothetical protein